MEKMQYMCILNIDQLILSTIFHIQHRKDPKTELSIKCEIVKC